MTVEVIENGWEQLCERIQEACHGGMVNIQLVESDGTATTIAQDLPLQRVALDDKSDPCNNNVIIEAGLPNEKPVRHVVIEPIHIRLKNDSGAERYNHLHILAENGTTIVTFHPGVNPELLKGIQL